MNTEERNNLESALREIAPAPPRPDLVVRIEKRMREERHLRLRQQAKAVLSWAGLAVAACLVFGLGLLLFQGRLSFGPDRAEGGASQAAPAGDLSTLSPSEGKSVFRQVLTENNLRGRIDEGIVFLDNGLTARRYRYQFTDRVVWQNTVDGAVVELEVPRDEVVLVPVQTF